MCVCVCVDVHICAISILTGSLGPSTPSPVVGGGRGSKGAGEDRGGEEKRGEETYKLLTRIYELIVSDCKHNNSLPVSACLLMGRESETETDRKNKQNHGVEK